MKANSKGRRRPHLHSGETNKRGATSLRLVIPIAAVVLAPAIALLVSHAAPAQAGAPVRISNVISKSATPTGIAVAYPVTLPTGYEEPSAILGTSAGVWAFAQGMVSGGPAETLFFWSNTTKTLTSYPINPSDAESLRAGGNTPIVVDNSGDAWVGINSNLVRVDPDSGAITLLQLPDVSTGAAGSGLPSLQPVATATGLSAGQIASTEALALGPGDSIVVGRFAATELQVVNTTTLAVSDLALPSDTALNGQGVTDLASDPNGGDVSTALYRGDGTHELGQYVDGSWTTATSPCPAYEVTEANDQLMVGGPSCVADATVSSDAASSPTSVGVAGLTQASLAVPSSSTTSVVCLGQGGMALVSGNQQTDFSLGTEVPGPSVGGASVNTSVQISPLAMSPGGPGMTWFVPDGGSAATIGLITT